MPIFYGIDPTGLGRKLGILTATKSKPPGQPDRIQAQAIKPAEPATVTTKNTMEAALTSSSEEPTDIRKDIIALTVPAKEKLNYKIMMGRDYALQYSWKTSDGKPIYHEFRGENKEAARLGELKVFVKNASSQGGRYSISPFTGEYSWYWDNKSDRPVSIQLILKGVYQLTKSLP